MKTPCENCKREIDESAYFCPLCGHKSSKHTPPLTNSQKIKIYLASFFLSPLGLIWFFKYFRDEKVENKKVAYISLAVTVIPLVLLFIVGGKYIDAFSSIIETYNTNLNVYTELGL